MKYPTLKIDGKKVKYEKKEFDRLERCINRSITFDNQENNLGLTKKDIGLLSWNGATMCLDIKG